MRPLLVLILVIAAIGALLFGVLSLLKDSPAPDGGGPTVTHPTETASPGQPPNLEPGAGPERNRETPVGKPGGDRGSASSAAPPWQYDNSLAGTVLTPQGQPLQGCEVSLGTWVELLFSNDTVDHSQDQTMRTNDEGRFAFRSLEPREGYKISVKHPQYTFKEVHSVSVGESGVFEEPPIKMAEGAVLQGHVRDEAGNLVDKAVLWIDGLMYQGAAYEPPDRMKAETDHEGWYSFANVPKGQRTLSVTAAGYGTVTLHDLNFDGSGTINRDIQLKVGEMIRGTVMCNGKGVAGAVVRAIGFANTMQSARGETTADERGVFSLENLAPVEYSLIAVARGYRFEQLTRQKTNTDNVVIVGEKEADVRGQVVDLATGQPVHTFSCRLRFNQGPGQPSMPSEIPAQSFDDPKGEFCISGVPQGEYLVEAQAPGYAPSFSAPLSVARGQAPPGTVVRLSRGGSLKGRVVDREGKPVPRARITTHDKEWSDDPFTAMLGDQYPTNATKAEVRAGEDGRFVITGLTPDIYQINVRAAGFTRLAQTGIVVTDGAETSLGDIKISRGGTLHGTLYGPDGKPLVGGQLSLNPTEGMLPQIYTAKSGQDGKFTMEHVLPGRYMLVSSRAQGAEANPFEQLVDQKSSQSVVTIVDDTTTTQDVTLGQ